MTWRKEVARAAGKPPLLLMEGFFQRGQSVYDPVFWLAKNHVRELPPDWSDDYMVEHMYQSLPIRWDTLKDDPLHVLLHHSDCEGEIDVTLLEGIANRLEEVAPRMPDGHHRERTRLFVIGCREAAAAGENLEFR